MYMLMSIQAYAQECGIDYDNLEVNALPRQGLSTWVEMRWHGIDFHWSVTPEEESTAHERHRDARDIVREFCRLSGTAERLPYRYLRVPFNAWLRAKLEIMRNEQRRARRIPRRDRALTSMGF